MWSKAGTALYGYPLANSREKLDCFTINYLNPIALPPHVGVNRPSTSDIDEHARSNPKKAKSCSYLGAGVCLPLSGQIVGDL